MFKFYGRHNGAQLGRTFSLTVPVASYGDMQELLGRWRASPKVRRLLGHRALTGCRGRRFIAEQQSGSQRQQQDFTGWGFYLQGYWQSEQYFHKYADSIRGQFRFRNDLSGRNADLASQIREGPSVSLHVRRGDYASCPKTRRFHGLCEPSYYVRAIELMRRHTPRFRLFAFSDDPQWVASTLQRDYPEMIVVDHNKGEQSDNDMRLMSMCNHHIIANSSFSWWGAWLNPDPGKVVIAPRKWFVGDTDSANRVPENWVRL
jgi:hypothetical protein